MQCGAQPPSPPRPTACPTHPPPTAFTHTLLPTAGLCGLPHHYQEGLGRSKQCEEWQAASGHPHVNKGGEAPPRLATSRLPLIHRGGSFLSGGVTSGPTVIDVQGKAASPASPPPWPAHTLYTHYHNKFIILITYIHTHTPSGPWTHDKHQNNKLPTVNRHVGRHVGRGAAFSPHKCGAQPPSPPRPTACPTHPPPTAFTHTLLPTAGLCGLPHHYQEGLGESKQCEEWQAASGHPHVNKGEEAPPRLATSRLPLIHRGGSFLSGGVTSGPTVM
ncbi:hypothetical protein GWK47_042661 [Chionoecetes opilio]|uniref:Uncharacterized protein n=1 Tax=Chionoecetes opilio TaxID=41210 RepID=A0A8J4YHP0_CHIOP|nr:hypothetical protein GWK47_042661 [Chionoecetes opilio]